MGDISILHSIRDRLRNVEAGEIGADLAKELAAMLAPVWDDLPGAKKSVWKGISCLLPTYVLLDGILRT